MDRPTFLDRRPLGIPNYLAIALIAMVMIAVVPRGARRAMDSNTNKAEDWLPASYGESVDLAWFRQQFGNQAFVLMSWEGCTLEKRDQLEQLANRFRAAPLTPDICKIADLTPHPDRRIFSRVTTGPELVDQLMDAPAKLDRETAWARLEGAMIGPATDPDDNLTRTTCLIAYLSPEAITNNRSMRLAIERAMEIATQDFAIAPSALHLGGPPVDNISIDIEGERTLRTLAGLSGLVGLLLAYACFRNARLTGMVLFVAVVSSGMSLAMVFYFGVYEVLVLGADSPRLGKMDAILMSMPAVVYVLSLSGAIHLVNYYRDAVRAEGRRGAVERAVRMAIVPCGLAALTTAIGLASLASSDILPIEKFGVFSAIGVLLALAFLFALLPVMLHRFATPIPESPTGSQHSALPAWARRMAEAICRHHAWVASVAILVMLFFALGLSRTQSSVQLIKLLDPQSDLVQDYAWLEENLGNLVPMEVVVAVPELHRREVNEHPEEGGGQYSMTTVQRLGLTRRIATRIEALEPVSRALSAATFSPQPLESQSPSNRRTYDYIVSEAIDSNRDDLREFLRWEQTTTAEQSPQELWRISARIAALDNVDYGEFVAELKEAVEPVLDAYRLRDQLVARLSANGQQLSGAKVCLVVPEDYTATDSVLAELLRESTAISTTARGRGRLWITTTTQLLEDSPAIQKRLSAQQAVVTLHKSVATQLADSNIECSHLIVDDNRTDRGISATYTGVVPLVYKTQRELLTSLQESLVLATLLIAVVLMVLLRSIGGALASMIPNLFPLVVVFGGLGWLGIPIDIGIMMTASVALGVAVDDTIHFVSWFRKGRSQGLSRYDSALLSYERCAMAMVQTTLIAGLGLAVFAMSTFTPTQQFGYLMVTILTAALVGDLVLLPALLVGPLGALFPAAGRGQSEITNDSPGLPIGPSMEPTATTSPPSPSPTQPDADPKPNMDSTPKVEASPELLPTDRLANQPLPASPSQVGEVSSNHELPPRGIDSAHESLSPANAALRAKLRRFRRETNHD